MPASTERGTLLHFWLLPCPGSTLGFSQKQGSGFYEGQHGQIHPKPDHDRDTATQFDKSGVIFGRFKPKVYPVQVAMVSER